MPDAAHALAVATLLALAGGPARAVSPEREAARLIDEGIVAYNTGDLFTALADFQKAHDLAPEKANPYRWLALTEVKLDKCSAAVEHFDAFLSRISSRDSRYTEAAVQRDKCREELARFGSLVVESDPPGADVHLEAPDAAALGKTPFRIARIEAGEHKVFLTLAGYAPASASITVERLGTGTVKVELKSIAPADVAAATTRPPPKPVATKTDDWHGMPRRTWYAFGGIGAAAVVVTVVAIALTAAGPGSPHLASEKLLPTVYSQ